VHIKCHPKEKGVPILSNRNVRNVGYAQRDRSAARFDVQISFLLFSDGRADPEVQIGTSPDMSCKQPCVTDPSAFVNKVLEGKLSIHESRRPVLKKHVAAMVCNVQRGLRLEPVALFGAWSDAAEQQVLRSLRSKQAALLALASPPPVLALKDAPLTVCGGAAVTPCAASPPPRCGLVATWRTWAASARCVEAQGGGGEVEMLALLSDDLSLLRMDARLKEAFRDAPFGGTEQDFVRAWRRAIAGSGAKGVTCIKEAWRQQQQLEGDPEKLGRREMLEHLQRKMDLEFLREHGLNKKLDRLLKSLTKQQVLDAWKAAGEVGASSQGPRPRGSSVELLEAVKVPLARLPEGSIVALLHEDCEAELNLFLRLTTSAPAVPAVPAVLFVLGAVRDMTQQELEALQLASTALKLKLVRLRIGATPEFSSKVVRCLAAAHLHDLVLPAVEDAINAKKKLRKKQASGGVDFTLLYALDFEASAVDLQTAGRRRLLQLLQLCVCTLWRSKIGDALTEGDVMAGRYLEPHLRLLFSDGTTLSLGTGFVEGMSRSHKAAPTERQLLEALQTRLQRKTPGPWQKRLRNLLAKAAQADADGCALLLSHEGWDPFAAHASTASTASTRKDGDVSVETVKGVLLMAAASPSLAEKLRKSCEEMELQTVPVSLAHQNAPSAVVMLQFMHYCNTLSPILQRLAAARCAASGKQPLKYDGRGCFRCDEMIIAVSPAPTGVVFSRCYISFL
ncbi:unnamed protein product, partial [Cladocopium goreaui]